MVRAILLVLLLGLLSAVGQAQSSIAIRNLEQHVYYDMPYLRPIFNPFRGFLGTNYYANVTIWVTRAFEYTVVGACDDNCDDLDFDLRDQYGRIVAYNDSSDDAYPQLTVVMYPNIRYTLVVRMQNCYVYRCEFATNVYVSR